VERLKKAAKPTRVLAVLNLSRILANILWVQAAASDVALSSSAGWWNALSSGDSDETVAVPTGRAA